MDPAAYAAEAKIEATHWWFTQRRQLFARLISQNDIPRDAVVVDIGTGTGANLRLLREMGFSNVTGIEPNPEAAHWCAEKGLGPVQQGDIRSLPLADRSVDLVLATDVIEHVKEDADAVAEMFRVLRPGGLALFTVPAFQSLWGLQDDMSHHQRRYRMNSFQSLVKGAGFEIKQNFYFNYILFVPIFAARQVIRVLGIKANSENEFNNRFLNRVLEAVFGFDVYTAPKIRPPFGVSILTLVQRPAHGGMAAVHRT
jgi:SAM-dependent methyltransferase